MQKHFNACRCTNIQYLPGSTVRIDDFPLPDISEFSLIFLKELYSELWSLAFRIKKVSFSRGSNLSCALSEDLPYFINSLQF